MHSYNPERNLVPRQLPSWEVRGNIALGSTNFTEAGSDYQAKLLKGYERHFLLLLLHGTI